MHIKLIVCNVKENLKRDFSKAQEKWFETRQADGFVGQIGGWDLNNENDACIVSFWKNKKSLESFMQNTHDKIIHGNQQHENYNSLSVAKYDTVIDMEGSSSSLVDAIKFGKLLRIADCLVREEKAQHFETVQKAIWLPGMKKANGMLGGHFSKAADHTPNYLVSSLWDSIENHKDYVSHQLPAYQIKADVQNDVEDMVGRQILLVQSWKIIK